MSDPKPETPPPSRGSLLVIFLTVFIDLLGFGMVLPLLPIYAKTFGVDKHGWQIGVLMASFSAMTFIFSPLWGRLSDRIGRRPVLLVGLAGSALFYFLFGLATVWQSLTWLFITRIGAGIAAATLPTAQAYIADVTTNKTRAKGMALIGAAFGLGFTFGPLLGFAAIAFSRGEEDIATSPWPGFVAAGLSASAMLLALLVLPESLRPGQASQSSDRHKLLDLRSWHDALTTPSVPALLVTAFFSVVSFGAFETTLSLLLESPAFNFELQQVLLFFAFIGLTLSLAQGLLVRRLASRVGEVALTMSGCVVTVVGFVLLALSNRVGPLVDADDRLGRRSDGLRPDHAVAAVADQPAERPRQAGRNSGREPKYQRLGSRLRPANGAAALLSRDGLPLLGRDRNDGHRAGPVPAVCPSRKRLRSAVRRWCHVNGVVSSAAPAGIIGTNRTE